MPTSKKDLENLTKLGNTSASARGGSASGGERTLEAFPNHAPGNLEVELACTEFTCRCPLTGQPDYAQIYITYVPDAFVVESKSLKEYLETFRDVGVFHEHLAVDIGQDFVKYIKPKRVEVNVCFNVRGGIAISATWSSEA